MTTYELPQGQGLILEKDKKMKSVAHGTQNIRQAKQMSNSKVVIAIIQGLRSFAKYSSFRYQEMQGINSTNQTKKEVPQKIEQQEILIQITHLPGVKNEITDSLSRLSRAGDNKLKEKIFQRTCLNIYQNPTIDLFSQYFNNLHPIFTSTTGVHGEITVDALNQTWTKEFLWIHPPIPLPPAILKNVREKQIEAMVLAPLWPSLI
ncbi:MAG: hypothetical protein EZS28_028845 [Streblomastix strix]|uniref:Uncharacterized protein n=1 Tax=Streblomastix strix TaxID=222440 RepID=A0A5J4UZW7_9EUKA|nr:MAG: hypothetical protein EZS28_028845 [Streblomastix strix]